MLSRQIVSYLPSLLVPAVVSFAAIFIYTRLLTPSEYGLYSLGLSAMAVLCSIGYFWLQTSLPRLIPEAVKQGNEAGFVFASYAGFSAVSMLMLGGITIYSLLFPAGDFLYVFQLAVPLAIARSLLTINQAFHRSHMRINRYNLIECGQAVLGLVLGLVAVIALRQGWHGALYGMMAGMGLLALVDVKMMLALRICDYNPEVMRRIIRFAAPMMLTYGVAIFLSVSDRFLVKYYCGAASLGVYAAAYTLMDRIMIMVFMTIATPSFPLLVNKHEHEGQESARLQSYYNGVAVLVMALPAAAGLILASGHIAALLVGAKFQEGARQVMPWIAASGLLNGLATHYFDHAFYLAKKPARLLLTQGPAALLNVTLNLMFIPRYGYMAAAYANFIAYALQLVLSAGVGRRVFALHFPWMEAGKIVAAVVLMVLIVMQFTFAQSWVGLLLMAAVGGITYGAACAVLNVGHSRIFIAKLLLPK